MEIEGFFDPSTFTLSYVIWDRATRDAVAIDPVLDYDVGLSETSTAGLERIHTFLRERDLRLHYVLETHAHADHLSGSQWLRRERSAQLAIGEGIRGVQATFKRIFDLDLVPDGSQYDRLLADNEVFQAGSIAVEVIAMPGHTPCSVAYKIGDAVFVGDALFMPDYGTGRCDFPGASAADLYDSITRRLYTLPDETRVFVGHDYLPGGRALAFQTTVGESKRDNIQLSAKIGRDQFIRFRSERDKTLSMPRLFYQSLQVNVAAGCLPRPHDDGRRYLTLPLNHRRPTGDDGSKVGGA